MDLLQHFEQEQVKDVERPKLRAGDVVRVEIKIREGGKSRLQTFEGTLLGIRGSGPSTTFTVRRETGGFGVERIFPLYSPLITNIEIVKRQKVRRAKLTYLRQAGRRRFKEDVKSMQRLVKEEEEKKRLAEERAKREADEKAEEEKAKKEAEVKSQEETKTDEEVATKASDNEEVKNEDSKAEAVGKPEE